MNENPHNCREEQVVRARGNTALLSETLRNSGSTTAAVPAKGEERISLFWRVFGGTLLSIGALVLVTVYQQFSNSMNELRSDLIRLNESRADLVHKDEFNSRLTSVWNNMKDLQNGTTTVTSLRERSMLLEQQLKVADDERKELTRELQRLRERVAVVEGRQHAASATGGHVTSDP